MCAFPDSYNLDRFKMEKQKGNPKIKTDEITVFSTEGPKLTAEVECEEPDPKESYHDERGTRQRVWPAQLKKMMHRQ